MDNKRTVTFRLGTLLMMAALTAGCGSSGTATTPNASGYTVGGTVAGLASGDQLTLLNNGTDALVVNSSGVFAFAGKVTSASPYAVTVAAAPAGQTCTVAGGSGMVAGANVGNVVVTCADRAYTLGGVVRGLSSSGLKLSNGGDELAVGTGASSFSMPQPVAFGSSYNVRVAVQPQSAACTVQAGSGTMPAGNVSSVVVRCGAAYPLSGTVSGLNGASGLTLVNGSQTLSVAGSATSFTLPQEVAAGTAYHVTVQGAPAGLQCAVNDGSGTMPAAPVSNIAVLCSPTTYTIGGSVTGLWATGLVLADGTDSLSVPQRAGVFTMPVGLPQGAHYAITVQTQPSGLLCSVGNGSGTVGSAAVTNVTVSCGTGAYTVGGSVSGLTGTGLVLENGSDTLAVLAQAQTFTMPTAQASGASYDVVVEAHPPAQYCSVGNGSGTVGNVDVTGVAVACGPGSDTVVHALAPGSGDGAVPYGGLLAAADGSLYALTYIGGTNGLGAVLHIAADGTETVLHSFAGTDGANPHGALIQGIDGAYYGVTAYGGDYNHGVVFRITSDGTETVLHSFGSGAGAQDPYGSLLLASDGNFYGLSVHGGAYGLGTVFRIAGDGSETVLHSFGAGTDGQTPFGSLIQGGDAQLYGMTTAGGDYGSGMAFAMTLAGAETVLHSFGAGNDGATPEGSLIQATDGNFYGLTRDGGANGLGAAIRIASDGTEVVLYSFGSAGDGQNPFGDLLQGSDGNFYATTRSGGSQNDGAVVQLSSAGTESVVYSFTGGGDGDAPYGSLIERADGGLLGMTSDAGSGGGGTVFLLN